VKTQENTSFRYTVEGITQLSHVGLLQFNLYPLKSSTVKVDYPPNVHALTWRLKKRCSTAKRELPLRNPHFYSCPFIENLNESSLGRPLGFLWGPTYGLTPLPAVGWTPRIEVYGDDPKGRYFKLESGGFCSAFRSIVRHELLDCVVFRGWYKFIPMEGASLKTCIADAFGQLVIRNALENVVKRFGNIEEIKHSAWGLGKLLGDARHTLEEVAKNPFVSYYQFRKKSFI
jgi:hypothetical protein